MFDPERRAERRRVKEQARAMKQLDRWEAQQETIAKNEAAKEAEKTRQAKELQQYGRLVCEKAVGLKTVRIYSRGYVKVAAMMFGGSASYERLIMIEFSGDVQKKTGPGRVGAAVLTGGANLLLTSNKRGDIYLTIATANKTHVLHEESPTAFSIRWARELAAAGQSVLMQLEAEASLPEKTKSSPSPMRRAPEPSARQQELARVHGVLVQLEAARRKASGHTTESTSRKARTVTDRLQELKSLHEQGMVTDAEFQELRSGLLNDL